METARRWLATEAAPHGRQAAPSRPRTEVPEPAVSGRQPTPGLTPAGPGCCSRAMRHCVLALLTLLPATLLDPCRGAVAPAAAQGLPIPVAPSHVGPTQPPPSAALPAPAVQPGPAAAPIPPAQAQQVLDLLRDDRRRAEFTATLEAIVRAAPPAAAQPGSAAHAAAQPGGGAPPTAAPNPALPATAPAESPAAAPGASPPTQPLAKVVPLAPDSLGAEVIERASAGLQDAGAQLAAAARSMNDLPLLWRWVATQAADPIARARVLDTAWKLAAVMLAALLVEAAAIRLLRRLRATLGRWTPGRAEAEAEAERDPAPSQPGSATVAEADDPASEAATQPAGDAASAAAIEATSEARRAARREHLTRTLGTLQRLPYLLGRLLLDLVPIGAFATAAGLLRGTALGQPATTGLVIRAVLLAYVLCRVVLSVTAFLVSPAAPRLRLLNVSGNTAGFLVRWTRRITVTAIASYTVTEVAVTFGLYNTARDALLKLFALAVHAMLVVAVLQARVPVAARIRAIRLGGVWSALLRRAADVWHLVAIFYIVALWLVWAAELRGGYTRLVQTFLVTSAVLIGSRLLAIVMLGGLDRALRPSAAAEARHPGLAGRVDAYYPVLRLAGMAVLWAATGLALLQAWGFSPLTWFSKGDLGSRILSAGVLIGGHHPGRHRPVGGGKCRHRAAPGATDRAARIPPAPGACARCCRCCAPPCWS